MAEPEGRKRNLEEPEEKEDPVAGLKNPSSSLNPDLDISTSGSKSNQTGGDGEDNHDDYNDDAGRRATMAKSSPRLQKKPRVGEAEVEDLQGKVKVQTLSGQVLGMEGSKSDELLPSTDFDEKVDAADGGLEEEDDDDGNEDEDDEDEDDDSPMSEEELKEWWEKWWEGEEEDLDLPKSPGWGYSDVDEDDPKWPDKFREKYCRQTPPKYRALLDSDYCPPGVEKKDDALWERYLKQIEESDGYDITDFPGLTMLTPITPIFNFKKCASYFEVMSACADAAIKKFNEEQDDQYEVHDILKVNSSGGMRRSSLYYITFEAKKKKKSVVPSADDVEDDQGGAPLLTTFQARVVEDFAIGKLEVQECRIKRFKPSTVCCTFVEPILKF